MSAMIVITVDARERARIMAIVYTVVITFTSPFGWIAGRLSEVNRSLPFVLNIVLFAIGGLLTYLVTRLARDQSTVEEAAEAAVPA